MITLRHSSALRHLVVPCLYRPAFKPVGLLANLLMHSIRTAKKGRTSWLTTALRTRQNSRGLKKTRNTVATNSQKDNKLTVRMNYASLYIAISCLIWLKSFMYILRSSMRYARPSYYTWCMNQCYLLVVHYIAVVIASRENNPERLLDRVSFFFEKNASQFFIIIQINVSDG
jgi:hypothetical protein